MTHADFLSSLFSLKGKRVVVTGASSGLGRHFAVLLAKAGAQVAVAARRVDKLQDLVADIRAAGAQAEAFAMDVSDPVSVRQALAEIVQWSGVPDVLINNAGVTVGKDALEQTPEEYIAAMVEVFRCVRDVLADDGTLFATGNVGVQDGRAGADAMRRFASLAQWDASTPIGRRSNS